MTEPVGIRRRRVKGFSLQEESRKINGLPARFIGRPTIWGNPYKIGEKAHLVTITGDMSGTLVTVAVTLENCLRLYENHARDILRVDPNWLDPLEGHNLACWCAVGNPCHRDILLKLMKERKG